MSLLGPLHHLLLLGKGPSRGGNEEKDVKKRFLSLTRLSLWNNDQSWRKNSPKKPLAIVLLCQKDKKLATHFVAD